MSTGQLNPQRRRLLKQITALIGAAAASSQTHALPLLPNRHDGQELLTALDRLFTHPESAAVIGNAYLDLFVDERSPGALIDAIRDSGISDAEAFDRQLLLSRIRMDFEVGNVVSLHGWILSRTEARLCAVFAV